MMITNEIKERLAEVLKTLDEPERMALALYYLEHLSLDEIGLVLCIDGAAVEKLIASSLKELQAKMIKGTDE